MMVICLFFHLVHTMTGLIIPRREERKRTSNPLWSHEVRGLENVRVREWPGGEGAVVIWWKHADFVRMMNLRGVIVYSRCVGVRAGCNGARGGRLQHLRGGHHHVKLTWI